jgi:hypothetical protein
MKICMLNASNPGETLRYETDEYVDLRCGPDSDEVFKDGKVLKQFNSWHAWPADLNSEFFVYGKSNWQNCYKYGWDGVIILVNRDIHSLVPLVRKLKAMKKKVAISFHEGVQDLITSSGMPGEIPYQRWVGLYDLVKEADYYFNIFDQFQSFFEGWFGKDKVKFVPHVALNNTGLSEHLDGFIQPLKDRPYDVLIGTRTFGQRLNRASLVSLATLNGLANEHGFSVHYLSEDGDVGPLLKRMGLEKIVTHVGPLSWIDWLKFLGQYRVVAHFDNSFNLGQICFDAMRVSTIPVGGVTSNNILLKTEDGGDSNVFKQKVYDNVTRARNGEAWENLHLGKERFGNLIARSYILEAFGAI